MKNCFNKTPIGPRSRAEGSAAHSKVPRSTSSTSAPRRQGRGKWVMDSIVLILIKSLYGIWVEANLRCTGVDAFCWCRRRRRQGPFYLNALWTVLVQCEEILTVRSLKRWKQWVSKDWNLTLKKFPFQFRWMFHYGVLIPGMTIGREEIFFLDIKSDFNILNTMNVY